MVTDRIETFTEQGILLASGQELEADITVTPHLLPEDQDMPKLPFVDPENFNAGYLM